MEKIYTPNQATQLAVVAMGHKLIEKKLVAGSWGNISCRLDNEHIAVTPSGIGYERITPEDIVIVTNTGQVTVGEKTPSSELKLHLAIYSAYPEAGAVIHTHGIYTSALAAMHKGIPAIIEDIVQIIGGRVQCAQYAMPGTLALAENAVAALGGHKAALLANHGSVCWGKNLDDALMVAEILEKAAHITILCGDKAVELDTGEVNAMHNFYQEHYFKRQMGEE